MTGESRPRILEFLKRHGSASVADLSRGLGLTPVTIRHHLESLLGDELVEEPAPRRRPGPGRPEMAYWLSPSADSYLPRNYGELCACLVGVLDGEPEGPVGSALAVAGAALGRSQVQTTGLARSDRRQAIVTILERRGYLPVWETSDEPASLVLTSCPYLEVARMAPGICQFDLGLIGAVLGVGVRLEASIAEHDRACRFRLQEAGI